MMIRPDDRTRSQKSALPRILAVILPAVMLAILPFALLSGCMGNFAAIIPTPLESVAPTSLTTAASGSVTLTSSTIGTEATSALPDIDGQYSAPEDVAAYIHVYGKLPSNYITKKQAADLGWDAGLGNLWDVTDQKSIGGDRFGNREGQLPDADGRLWFECDVNYAGGLRGAERLVFSNDGLVYYTSDHYSSFTRLY